MAFNKAKALQEAEKSVVQGKISQAIRQYLDIIEHDPADLALLNTVGDLHVRERNLPEAFKQFQRLAEAYIRDGFSPKAVAIYRKITKLDPSSVDALLRLAELYKAQGLSREARDLYLQAVELLKKRKENERALAVLRNLAQLDPGNLNLRARLASECKLAGLQEEAARLYAETAEALLERGEADAAEAALEKVGESGDPKLVVLRARTAMARQRPEEAERLIRSSPKLEADLAAKRLLLEATLATSKFADAEELVTQIFAAVPADFAPVARVSGLLVGAGKTEEAYRLLGRVAESALAQNLAEPLLEALRAVARQAPQHIPTLELIYQVSDRTANELLLPEALEALGQAREQAGDLEGAETAYRQLLERQPENEHYRGFLEEVRRKTGKHVSPAPSLALEERLPAPVEATPPDPARAALVKEGLDNSDLYARYNLPEKAIAELEKVLEVYPDEVELLQRIIEISRKGSPDKGKTAAARLAAIFAARGDARTAARYQATAAPEGEPAREVAAAALPQTPAAPPGIPAEAQPGFDLIPPGSPVPPSGEPAKAQPAFDLIPPGSPVLPPGEPAEAQPAFNLMPPESPALAPPLPPTPPAATGGLEIPLPPSPTAQAEPETELDLSEDWEAATAAETSAPPAFEQISPPPPEPAEAAASGPMAATVPVPLVPEIPAVVPAPEAAGVVPTEPAVPGVPRVLAVSEPAGAPLPAPPAAAVPAELEDARVEIQFYLEHGFVDAAREALSTLEGKYPSNPMVAELKSQVEKLPPEAVLTTKAEGAAAAAQPPSPAGAEELVATPELAAAHMEVAARSKGEEAAAAPVGVAEGEIPLVPPISPPMPPAAPSADLLGDLASGLEFSLDLAPAEAIPPQATPPPSAALPPLRSTAESTASLSGLLAEMEGVGAQGTASEDDPATHYNLGVAFREMNLLDEAIGEFQKVARLARNGVFPPNYLQACSLLADCFMEKKMPSIAAKWYVRAKEAPGLDDEAMMALDYDLGVAYELAGDLGRALEQFSEVYSQNIDYRDVAEKVRELNKGGG